MKHGVCGKGIATLFAWCRKCGDNCGYETNPCAASTPDNDAISYAGCRFPPDTISSAMWLYFRFPLSLRMVEELLAARGIEVTYETVQRWLVKFGLGIAWRICLP
ncbi:hypothetical protein [Burkholderia sp. BKH01]|uniref:hypothetical protein n=1 Tax=Burkholderia sp. BKH01 TaxID=2769262 RepID=UPI00398BDDC6